ncbi:MAG: ABC transporter permease subunit [Clostridiales bacterium]|nr:ABC transporter permease subunit [Clostridiales bacterium]
MKAFLASYRNEWCKLMLRKKYIVFLCAGAGMDILWILLGRLAAAAAERQIEGLSLFLTPTPMGALPFFLQIVIPFLIFMGVTDLITVECSESTMRAILCRPVERWKLYASKILAVVTYTAAYLVCVFAISIASNQLFGSPLGVEAVFFTFISYTLPLIPLTVLACFAALVALLGRSGTLTMLLLLLLYLALNLLSAFFPVLSEMLFTSYLGWYKLWIGALPRASKLVHMLIIVLGYGTVFFIAGSLFFDRKEY